MNLDLPDGFLDLASVGLFEALMLGGYGLYLLEDAEELVVIVADDNAFSGFRKYEGEVLEAIRETALENLNTLMVAELREENEV